MSEISLPSYPDDLPIRTIGLSTRSIRCLERLKCKTVGDVRRLSDDDILLIKNTGKTSLIEIREKTDGNNPKFNHPISSHSDISLMDYFAASALNGYLSMCTDDNHVLPVADLLARYCYDYADAMIAERQKRRNQ